MSDPDVGSDTWFLAFVSGCARRRWTGTVAFANFSGIARVLLLPLPVRLYQDFGKEHGSGITLQPGPEEEKKGRHGGNVRLQMCACSGEKIARRCEEQYQSLGRL